MLHPVDPTAVPVDEYVPTGQISHCVDDTPELYVPDGQEVHELLPDVEIYVPTGQEVQAKLPGCDE
jgi:hypothetical protein